MNEEPQLLEPTEDQRERLLAEVAELKANRLAARKDARSGNPAKAAQGRAAVTGITELIRVRNQALKQMEDAS